MKPADKLIQAIKEAKNFGWSDENIVEAILKAEHFYDKDRTINAICEQLI